MTDDNVADAWVAALIERHTRAWSRPEFLKAARALSARYVEPRHPTAPTAPADSPAKRAAFAALFAPLHFFTARAVIRRLGASAPPPATIVDLGCGTGAVSAAWASECNNAPAVLGIDREPWALTEARSTWSHFGVRAAARRTDVVSFAADYEKDLGGLFTKFVKRPPRSFSSGRDALRPRTAIVLGWTVNELPPASRDRLLALLQTLTARGASLLIIEPISRRVSPWWTEWTSALAGPQARADEWTFDLNLPQPLIELDEAAGFRRDTVKARSFWSTSLLPLIPSPERG